MITIYEVKTGKPHSVEYIIDAKESVANGFYTFTPPAPKEEKVAPVVPKVVKPIPVKVPKPLTKKIDKPKNILKKKK